LFHTFVEGKSGHVEVGGGGLEVGWGEVLAVGRGVS
jgi:hypothetical protein